MRHTSYNQPCPHASNTGAWCNPCREVILDRRTVLELPASTEIRFDSGTNPHVYYVWGLGYVLSHLRRSMENSK